MKGLQVHTCTSQDVQNKGFEFKMIISVLLMSGFSKIFLSGFSRLAPYWWLYAIGGSAVCFLSLWLYMGRWKDYVLMTECAALLILFLIRFSVSRNGVFIMLNKYMTHLTGKNGKIYLDYPVTADASEYYTAAIFIALVAVLAAQGACYGKTVVIFAMALICFAGCMEGFLTTDYGWVFLVAGLIVLLFYRRFLTSDMEKRWQTFAACAAVIAGCCALGGLGACVFNLNTDHKVKSLERAIHQWQYDDENNAMPEGDLSNVRNFVKDDHTSLVVNMEVPQKLYLRGMIGDVYTGTSWEQLGAEALTASESTFYWLHKSGFYGHNILGNAFSLREETDVVQLTVSNISACKEHQYLPYALADSETLDWRAVSDGTADAFSDAQTVSYVAGSIPQWYTLATYLAQNQSDKNVNEYLKYEQSYRTFVYENELQITNSAVGVCNRILGTEKEAKSLADILEIVKDTLDKKLTYNENIYTLNGRSDFMKYTLEQTKEGYSVHYATAATLMLRYFGVPARYVEGYYISAEEAGASIELTEAHAHAWTEYYMDGVGWIPFEVTPGYIDEDEMLEATLAMADSLENGTGKSFNQNPLSYTPPTAPQDEMQLPDLNSLFRFEARYLIPIFIVVILLLIVIMIIRILLRRKKLMRFLEGIIKADNRTAIVDLFGYAMMLMDRCNVRETKHFMDAKLINQEARFSIHEMNDDQKRVIEVFKDEVVTACKQSGSTWQRFKYHYILWLYK